MTTTRDRTPRQEAPAYDPARARALLKALSETDEYGTAEEQRETLMALLKAVDEDRPGQRSIFGKGSNPPASEAIQPANDADAAGAL